MALFSQKEQNLCAQPSVCAAGGLTGTAEPQDMRRRQFHLVSAGQTRAASENRKKATCSGQFHFTQRS